MISRRQVQENFVFKVSNDFHGPDGAAPSWADGYPKQWGEEADSINVPTRSSQPDEHLNSRGSAVSLNDTLLAIPDHNGILVYDTRTKELRQRIRDGEHPIRDLWFVPTQRSSNYTLVCSRESRRGFDGAVEIYQLDQYGRLNDEDPPIDAPGLAAKAFASIHQDLIDQYSWTDQNIESLHIEHEFQKVLEVAEIRHTTKNRAVIEGSTSGFGSIPFDSNGRYLLVKRNNRTTQSGMRPPEELPQIVVFDLAEKKEIFSLAGHTDAIMWSGYSHDCKQIASISWDGSARVYDATTGQLMWKTDTGGGQAWAASFSMDSKYIVVSTGSGRVVTVHNSQDGRVAARLSGVEVKDWIRNLAWRPTNDYAVAFSCGTAVYIWRPFEDSGTQMEQTYTIDDGAEGRFRHFMPLHVDWLEDGKKIIVSCGDGSCEVWDVETNTKWRMLKPRGQVVVSDVGKPHLIKGADGENILLSSDGDRVVRFWAI